jgi:hypothetical protein
MVKLWKLQNSGLMWNVGHDLGLFNGTCDHFAVVAVVCSGQLKDRNRPQAVSHRIGSEVIGTPAAL